MEVRVNRRIEMGVRALEFCRAHQFQDPGYNSSVKQLEDQVAHAKLLGSEQERGIKQVHAATSRKSTLSRTIRRSQLVHLATIAQRAAKELPELEAKFDITGLPRRQLPFRTAARNLLEQAEQHKELLVKYGLVEEVLVGSPPLPGRAGSGGGPGCRGSPDPHRGPRESRRSGGGGDADRQRTGRFLHLPLRQPARPTGSLDLGQQRLRAAGVGRSGGRSDRRTDGSPPASAPGGTPSRQRDAWSTRTSALNAEPPPISWWRFSFHSLGTSY